MDKTLTNYIASLAQPAHHPSHVTEPIPECEPSTLRPLIDRVRDLLARTPNTVKVAGLNLREIQARLKGRGGKLASAQELGNCLRTLGYHRYRGWSDRHRGFIARWYAVR